MFGLVDLNLCDFFQLSPVSKTRVIRTNCTKLIVEVLAADFLLKELSQSQSHSHTEIMFATAVFGVARELNRAMPL